MLLSSLNVKKTCRQNWRRAMARKRLSENGKSNIYIYIHTHTWFVQKVSGLTTLHEVDKAYGVLTLIDFNTVPLRSYTLRPTFLPLLETFCELLVRDI